ncbi:MAG: dTMP kinase [Alphaproteobacteria bacterium]
MTAGSRQGLFIAVDGIDGAGKSKLIEGLAAFLSARSHDPLITREPTGDSEWGRALRRAAKEGRLSKQAEIEHFHRDRLHHIATVIGPALAEGRVVITDRYVDSTLAYQADDPAQADELYQSFVADGVLVPDVTLILCCPIETGLARAAKRGGGKMSAFEKSGTLRKASVIFAARRGANYVRIDASGEPEATLRLALAALAERSSLFRAKPAQGTAAGRKTAD